MFSGYRGSITKPPPGTPINPFHPLSQGLVGYWLFNEGAGSRANDISGHGNHGTLKNMAPNAQGSGWGGSKFGGGLHFDGTDDYVGVDVDDHSSLDITNNITVAMWVKFDQMGNMGVISKGLGSVFEPYMIAFDTSNHYFQITDTGDNRLRALVSGGWITGKWLHIVGTYDGANIKLYQNGIVENSTTIGAVNIKTNASDLAIGAYYSTLYTIHGLIDLVCIYNRALSAQEVKTLHEDPFCNLLRVPVRYSPAAPAAAIMNQFQNFNIGADLYNGAIIA
jgi:hypothetical protein